MRVQKQFQKRNKAIIVLLLPAVVFFWIIGWSLYWIGHHQGEKRTPEPARRKDPVTLLPALTVEEPEEITA